VKQCFLKKFLGKRFPCYVVQAKIDFLKWYLSVNSSEIYGKLRVFRPKKIKEKSSYVDDP
jgi:hypothetical protein